MAPQSLAIRKLLMAATVAILTTLLQALCSVVPRKDTAPPMDPECGATLTL